MSRLKPLWTVALVLILLMGLMPFLMSAIGSLITHSPACEGDGGDLCEWGIRLHMFIFFGFGTIPVMFVCLAMWAIAKAIFCNPKRAKSHQTDLTD